MAVIPNKWVKQEKPKAKAEPKAKAASKHVPTLSRANMVGTLRGIRK